MVMLWLSGDMLVKPIETLPALAVSEELSYFSWPSALAARLSVPAPLGVAVPLDVLVAAGVLIGVEAEEVVLLEELPQPARASRPTASVSAESFGMKRFSACTDPPLVVAIGG